MNYKVRTRRLEIRVTPEEKLEIESMAKKVNLKTSEYMRRVCLMPPEITREEFKDKIVKPIFEINKIGVNINQIAKKYNEHEFTEPRDELLDELREVQKLLLSIRQEIGKALK